MKPLGQLFDLVPAFVSLDLQTARDGDFVSLKNAEGVVCVLFKAADGIHLQLVDMEVASIDRILADEQPDHLSKNDLARRADFERHVAPALERCRRLDDARRADVESRHRV